jgi:hypothetical protein
LLLTGSARIQAMPEPTAPCLTAALEERRFLEVLQELAAGSAPREGRALAAIAAQHLGLWVEARAFARAWARDDLHAASGPPVSIVVPTRNRRGLLRRALASVAAQLYRPIEVVVVNDAGADVDDVLDEFRPRLDVVAVVNPRNVGLAGARNIGIERAGGAYLGYLDDDDQLYPHHVGHLIARLQATGARAAQAAAHLASERRLDRFPLRPFELPQLLVENAAPVQTVLHEASLLDLTGRFDTTLAVNEDWDLWIRLVERTRVVQTDTVTSCVDTRSDGERMTSARGLAAFAVAHAAIYGKHASLAERTGGAALRSEQQRHLQDLQARAAREERC